MENPKALGPPGRAKWASLHFVMSYVGGDYVIEKMDEIGGPEFIKEMSSR